jgi:3-mercaptopyruvate sulfurtransferase SseA
MILGGLAVLGLVGWALSRSFAAPVHSTLTTTEPASVATQAAPVPNADEEAAKAAVPRISAEDLRQRMLRNEVTVLDVRTGPDAFSSGHIPGSLHIPLTTVEAQLAFIPRTKPIVTYCT